MTACCKISEQKRHRKHILIAVLVINTIMFVAQFGAAMIAHSSSLMADSLDMLGDALTYSISLYAMYRGGNWINKAALFKAGIIAVFGIAILIQAGYKIFIVDLHPRAEVMTMFSLLGLIANLICFYLLTAERDTDVNMRSTWICARNDIVGNCAILLTAGLVYVLHSRWPDIIVGIGFSLFLLWSSTSIWRNVMHKTQETEELGK